MAYERVNGAWPAVVPPVTDREAITAAKRLWRFGVKEAFDGAVRVKKLRGRSVELVVTGDKHLRIKRVMYVDPRHGWRGIVHSMSHRVHSRLHRHSATFKSHDTRHHFIEKEMVEHVVRSGWLDAKLRRPEKPKVKVDPRRARLERIEAKAKRWEAKQKRARNALAKLARQRAYYERTLAA